ncbi:MAG: hypothetical protein HZB55_10165 [Deltaproteobacteria bacterium]|nr:hypothetical protein [Deltaproteobacteria bacterium]
MEPPDHDAEALVPEARPTEPRRRPGGGISTGSLLGSILLHLAALFLVIVLAPQRGAGEHDAVLIDIGQFVLPEPAPTSPEVPPKVAGLPEPAPPPEAPADGAPAEIPTEDAAAPEEPPATEPSQSAQEPESASPEAAEKTEATAPVPESTLPHEHGAYDPFEVYKASLAERVSQVMTTALRDFPILRVFRGRLVVHLYLNREGRPEWFTDQAGLFIRGAAICLHHKGYQIEPVVPMSEATFRWHCEALDQRVVAAINAAAPYPAAPPGVTVPRELSYVFDLPDTPAPVPSPAPPNGQSGGSSPPPQG